MNIIYIYHPCIFFKEYLQGLHQDIEEEKMLGLLPASLSTLGAIFCEEEEPAPNLNVPKVVNQTVSLTTSQVIFFLRSIHLFFIYLFIFLNVLLLLFFNLFYIYIFFISILLFIIAYINKFLLNKNEDPY